MWDFYLNGGVVKGKYSCRFKKYKCLVEWEYVSKDVVYCMYYFSIYIFF